MEIKSFKNTITNIMGTGHSKLTPDAVSTLCDTTQFDKREIQTWYRTFTRELGNKPTISKEQMRHLFKSFFPFGDATKFADLVFLLFSRSSDSADDSQGEGVSYADYLTALSVASRGRMEDKIKWTFRFYDVDGDGRVSRDDLHAVLQAAFEMAVGMVDLHGDDNADTVDTPEARTERIFARLALDDPNYIDYESFRRAYHDDPNLLQGLIILDGLV